MSDGNRSRPADRLKPGAGDHAIMRVGFGAIFDKPIPDEGVRKMAGLHDQVKGEYPRLMAASDGNLKDTDGILPSPLRAVSFEQGNGADGVGRTIRLGHLTEKKVAALGVSRKDYTTWSQVWENDAKAIFDLMLPPLLEHANIDSLELRYHDRFIWTGGYDSLLPDSLIKDGCPYFPPHIFRAGGIWRGDFDFYELPPACPGNIQIIGIKFQVVPTIPGSNKSEYAIDIFLDHRISFREQAEPIRATVGYDGSKTDLLMNIMHDTNKRLLSETLTDVARKKVNLENP